MDDFLREMRNVREQAKRDGEEARLMAEDGVTPEVGKVYTVSRDFRCNDGSWTDCFWRVLSKSGPNILVEIVGEHKKLARLFVEDERAWYPADEAFAAWEATREPQ